MKQWLVKNILWKAITTLSVISILVIGVSYFLLYKDSLIGPAYIILGLLVLGLLNVFGIRTKAVYPDIIFGVIDNGILIFAAVLGGSVAGVAGAILGGAAGNTITDGVGGLFEGRIAERLKRDHFEEERNSISTMLGKIVGCLIGAGFALMLVWGARIVYTGFFAG